MKSRNKPLRTCVACRQKKEKTALLRVVKNKSGAINIDASGKMEGRGVYVCRTPACVDITCKKKLINRGLKCNVAQQVYDTLCAAVKKENG